MDRIEIEQETDGRWIAEVVGVPGVLAYGRTPDEASRLAASLLERVSAEKRLADTVPADRDAARADAGNLITLIEALECLALNPTGQVAWMDRLGVGADELALQFNDMWCVLDQLVDKGHVPRAAQPALAAINRAFEAMGANPVCYEDEALSAAPQWAEIRTLAREVLGQIKPG